MNNFSETNGFLDFIEEMPLFFKLFGGAIFLIVIGTFIYVLVRGLSRWISNNATEISTKRSTVTDKRTEVWGGSSDSSANTNYYITFELEDHTRVELHVRANQFGLISIGDQGELTYQGTRFKEFNRIV